jgi:sec-independent protein translocase protein TatA
MGNLGFGELLIIFIIILVLFGGKKIPGLAKSLGEGIRSFKKAINEDESKDSKKD